MIELTFHATFTSPSLEATGTDASSNALSLGANFDNPSLEVSEANEASSVETYTVVFGKVFKGDKGDKGDTGEKGDKGDKGDTPVITAAADGTLYSDGALLTTVVKESAALASSAASNANTKATLADTAATNANTKAALANTAASNANAKATEAYQAAVLAGLKVFCTEDEYEAWKTAGTLHENYEYNIYEE